MDFKCFENKTCAVCGDVALGYNFNAVTCESCKAFFRRNALKDKELRCPFKESCQINSITRRFCQRCRLAKCYIVGMKRELIMTEADKERKRRKMEVNKSKQGPLLMNIPKQVHQENVESISVGTQVTPITCDQGIQTDISDCSSCSFSTSAISQPGVSVYSPTPGLSPPDGSDPTSPVSSCSQKNNADGFMPLSPAHRLLLDDLIMANKALEAPVDQEMNNLLGEEFKSCGSKSLLDVINLTALAIRRLIKMCKRIVAFRSLCQEDQLSLLKQGCTQMMILRSVTTFDPDKNSWKIPHTVDDMSRIKVEVLKEARGNLYEAHESFFRSFDSRASRDGAVICILIALALFEPNRNNLEDRTIVAQHQETYYDLLLKYLESLYSYRDAKELYDHLLFKMTELAQLNEEYVRVYLNVNPSQVEPLLIEIFDLKPH